MDHQRRSLTSAFTVKLVKVGRNINSRKNEYEMLTVKLLAMENQRRSRSEEDDPQT